MREKKPKKTFADKLKSYRTYDPSKEGYGNVRQWKRDFDEVMGHDEAVGILGEDSPMIIFGISVLPETIEDLRKIYRRLIMANHPDRGGDPKKAEKIIAAFSELSRNFSTN